MNQLEQDFHYALKQYISYNKRDDDLRNTTCYSRYQADSVGQERRDLLAPWKESRLAKEKAMAAFQKAINERLQQDPTVRSDEWSARMWPLARKFLKRCIRRSDLVDATTARQMHNSVVGTIAPKWPWRVDAADHILFLEYIGNGGPCSEKWSAEDYAMGDELLKTIRQYLDAQQVS